MQIAKKTTCREGRASHCGLEPTRTTALAASGIRLFLPRKILPDISLPSWLGRNSLLMTLNEGEEYGW